MKVKYSDLEMALEFASADYLGNDGAYLCLKTGAIHYDTDCLDEEIPNDLHDEDKYIQIPSKREFDLGKSMALRFAGEKIPDDLDSVYSMFRKRGAYRRFKDLVERRDMLEEWYEFSASEVKKELMNWCEEIGVEVEC